MAKSNDSQTAEQVADSQQLPVQECLSDDEKIRRGEEAEDFVQSPEFEYLTACIEREITTRKLEKLVLGRNGGDRLRELVIEIELLEDMKAMVQRDLYVAKGAKEREAKRNA